MAMGEEPVLNQNDKKKRASKFFWGTMLKQVPKLLSRKTFKLADIPEDPPPYGEAW